MRMSRVLAGPAVALAAALGATVAAAPAQAAVLNRACTPATTEYHACLTVESTPTVGEFKIIAGLDSFVSPAEARRIVAGGGPFWADLYADDSSSDPHLASIPLSWVGAGSGGLGQEHVIWLGCSKLDEDSGVDEIYAKISWRDAGNGVVTTRKTKNVEYEFRCW